MRSEQETLQAIERYSDTVRRLCMIHLKNSADTEDIFQTVFLKYVLSSVSFQDEEHEKAWLIRVAINCCKSMVSSAWIKRTCSLEDARQAENLFQQEEESGLFELMAKLPAIYRTVLYLRYYEEYQVKEIAKLLHITPNLVSARLSRAKKLMKKEILKERKCIENETGIIQRNV